MADITETVIVIASVNTSTLNRSLTLLLLHYHEKPQKRESACRGLTFPWLLRTSTAVGCLLIMNTFTDRLLWVLLYLTYNFTRLLHPIKTLYQ
ncbi:hypothetical protein M0804_001752 [Polistes exclamans]|nr:hypothetical protein M0804_001752 [Polistes exclamans]